MMKPWQTPSLTQCIAVLTLLLNPKLRFVTTTALMSIKVADDKDLLKVTLHGDDGEATDDEGEDFLSGQMSPDPARQVSTPTQTDAVGAEGNL